MKEAIFKTADEVDGSEVEVSVFTTSVYVEVKDLGRTSLTRLSHEKAMELALFILKRLARESK